MKCPTQLMLAAAASSMPAIPPMAMPALAPLIAEAASVSTSLATPPERLAPPITTAAMALSSYPPAVAGSPMLR